MQTNTSSTDIQNTEIGPLPNHRLHLSIYRYNPDVDKAPYMQDYEIDTHDFHGVMLLDVLEGLKVKDPTLAFRRSCSEGVCGSDGMNINGQNGLACVTSYLDLGNKKIVLRPLPGLPVVRDLIVDMTQFYKQYEKAKPFLQNDEPLPEKERLQSIEDRKKLDGLYECILCACCTTSCPSFWWNPELFLGPAALLWAYRFVADSRDTHQDERLTDLQDPFSLFRCRGIMNCVSVCPKGLNPTKAIGHLRGEILKKAV
jgi:succinate dehydrogenase / fumarate reductase iron-sulfur subunit